MDKELLEGSMKDRHITADMLRKFADEAKPHVSAKTYDLVCRRSRAAAREGKYSVDVALDIDADELNALMDKLDGDGFKTRCDDSIYGTGDDSYMLHISWEKPKAKTKKEKK